MRRIFSQMCMSVIMVAALLWMAAPAGAQHGHGDRGGSHPTPHGGSVHFDGHVEPAHVVHEVPHGIVRDEHYEHPDYHGVYRNPYRDDYFKRFRPGYWPIVVGDVQYYVYSALPIGFQTVVVNGVTYYLFEGVYYLPYIYGGQTVYMAVPPPI